MHLDPSLPSAWHSLFRQPLIVQRSLHNARPSHPPVTPATAAGFVHLRRVDAQPDEMPPPCARPFSLLPVAQAPPPSQPLVQFRYPAVGLADPKVVQPAHHVAPEFCKQPAHRYAPAATRDMLNPFFEPFEGLVRPHDSAPAYLKAEEDAARQRRGLALLAVDHQFEPGFHKPSDARHNPLGGPEAPDQKST